jgi:hypothetical protein
VLCTASIIVTTDVTVAIGIQHLRCWVENRRFSIPIAMVTSMVRGQNKCNNPEGVE